ncbi:MAG: sugar transferase, partial [bacterium]|nr:sugar transferase [bacterium]
MLLMPWALLVLTLVQFLLLAVCDYAANTIYFKLYKARHILVVFNDDEKSRNIINKMRLIKERFVIEKGVTTNRSIEEIEAEIDRFETVLICDIDKVIKNEILRYCYAEKKRVYLLPSVIDILVNNGDQVQIFDTPVIICRNRGLRVEQRILKRCMDLFISVVSLLALSPLMLITALSIKLCDGGPVFFKQNRVTYNGKIFNILKFRSMIVDADKDGAKKAVNNDCRITPVGRIIRRYRIDELPQLINVLFGTMSIVGPRPERTENVHEYTEQLPEFPLRHRVKAGLTGYAQIYGKYNTSPADKLNMDLIYIEKYSIFSDIKLLIMTIKILFVKESTEGFDEQSNSNVKKTSKKRVSE